MQGCAVEVRAVRRLPSARSSIVAIEVPPPEPIAVFAEELGGPLRSGLLPLVTGLPRVVVGLVSGDGPLVKPVLFVAEGADVGRLLGRSGHDIGVPSELGNPIMILRITHRDIALHQLGEADLGSQLFAIKGVLRRNQEDNKAAKADIDALAEEIRITPGQDPGLLLADLFDHLHRSVFLNAAHSMAAVGMLAPFVESLFVWIFWGIEDHPTRRRRGSESAKSCLGERVLGPAFCIP